MAFEHEDDELEKLKEWWKENGTATIMGVAMGVALILGWRGWNTYQDTRANTASSLYEQAVVQFSQDKDQEARQATNKLLNEFSGTTYAALASLMLAKQAMDDGQAEAAPAHLDWVIENAKLPQLQNLARLRKARLLLAADNAQGALQVLEGGEIQGYDAAAQTIKGDIYLALGQLDKAKAAYATALEDKEFTGPDRQRVQLQSDDLGAMEPALVAQLSEADAVYLQDTPPAADKPAGEVVEAVAHPSTVTPPQPE